MTSLFEVCIIQSKKQSYYRGEVAQGGRYVQKKRDHHGSLLPDRSRRSGRGVLFQSSNQQCRNHLNVLAMPLVASSDDEDDDVWAW